MNEDRVDVGERGVPLDQPKCPAPSAAAPHETGIDPLRAKEDRFSGVVRLALAALGLVLLSCGVVIAFVGGEGAATVAVMAAGTAVLVLAYLGPYITRIKFKEFEAELEDVRRSAVREVRTEKDAAVEVVRSVKQQAEESVRALRDAATTYETLRATMPGGGQRDARFASEMKRAEDQARNGKVSSQQVAEWFASENEGDRMLALGAMRGDPRLRDLPLVLRGIDDPHAGFDQDRFLVLAAEMVPSLDDDEKAELRRVVEQQRRTGHIKPHRIRWLSAERLLRLLAR